MRWGLGSVGRAEGGDEVRLGEERKRSGLSWKLIFELGVYTYAYRLLGLVLHWDYLGR